MIVNEDEVTRILEEVKPATLVAATKYVDVGGLNELEKLGVKVFGENRVPALLEKYEQYHGKGSFYMIGTLQTNKVRYIIDKVDMIHSVNTLKLIDEIDRQAKKNNLIMKVLIQVNIAKEESKHGFSKEELPEVFEYLKQKPNIKPCGLMMMAPNIESSETEKYFKETKETLDSLQKQFPEFSLTELSMGMSNDYHYALKHGSTFVRIGRALLKENN